MDADPALTPADPGLYERKIELAIARSLPALVKARTMGQAQRAFRRTFQAALQAVAKDFVHADALDYEYNLRQSIPMQAIRFIARVLLRKAALFPAELVEPFAAALKYASWLLDQTAPAPEAETIDPSAWSLAALLIEDARSFAIAHSLTDADSEPAVKVTKAELSRVRRDRHDRFVLEKAKLGIVVRPVSIYRSAQQSSSAYYKYMLGEFNPSKSTIAQAFDRVYSGEIPLRFTTKIDRK